LHLVSANPSLHPTSHARQPEQNGYGDADVDQRRTRANLRERRHLSHGWPTVRGLQKRVL